ncbi:MAG: hypothetical protein WCO28_10610 [Bacteroidota bacterium]
MKKLFLLALIVTFLPGCDKIIRCDNSRVSNIYQIVASSEGCAFRLNKQTGEVSLIEKDGITVLDMKKDVIKLDRKAIDDELKRRGAK